jgi:hypothetical protein
LRVTFKTDCGAKPNNLPLRPAQKDTWENIKKQSNHFAKTKTDLSTLQLLRQVDLCNSMPKIFSHYLDSIVKLS